MPRLIGRRGLQGEEASELVRQHLVHAPEQLGRTDGWDELLVQAPTRIGAPPVDHIAPPPTFEGEQAAVVAAFRAWLDANRGGNVDGLVAAIEDGERLRSTFTAMTANPSVPPDLSGRVDSVRLVGSDHALVTFSILSEGKPRLSDQQGAAVRVNGRWGVSRATYCDIVSLVGVTCPAP